MGVNAKKLIEQYRSNPEAASTFLRESMEKKTIKPHDFDLGSLFVECFGWDTFRDCRSGKRLVNEVYAEQRLAEAQGAVSTSAFLNITGQIVYSAVLEKYDNEDFVFTPLIPEVTTQFLDGEKMAGITRIGDESAVRNEGDPYALAGVGEDWIFTPAIKDQGMIVPVTWEAVFADRTGQLLERCGEVGFWRGQKREKEAIDCFVDENVTTHRYNWRGTTIASYGDNSGTHSWDNLAASNAIASWNNLDTAEQVFNAITDPYTGEPVPYMPKHLVVTKQNEKIAYRLVTATEHRDTSPGYATSGTPSQAVYANPYNGKFQVISSRLLATRMATDTSWFLADIGAYAKYMVAEKMNVVQAPSNSDDEFKRRIVNQFRVNERGQYVVVQPRASVKSTA